jgi:hypothetical protein
MRGALHSTVRHAEATSGGFFLLQVWLLTWVEAHAHDHSSCQKSCKHLLASMCCISNQARGEPGQVRPETRLQTPTKFLSAMPFVLTFRAPHISLALAGVEIISNGSGSHHQLRKLDTRIDLIRGATRKVRGTWRTCAELWATTSTKSTEESICTCGHAWPCVLCMVAWVFSAVKDPHM